MDDIARSVGSAFVLPRHHSIGVKADGHEHPYHRVPKRDLISTVALLLQNKRLKFAEGLPVLPQMLHELLNFKVKLSDAGHDSYSAWREQDHDDLVLSRACAAWVAEVQTTYVPTLLPPSISQRGW